MADLLFFLASHSLPDNSVVIILSIYKSAYHFEDEFYVILTEFWWEKKKFWLCKILGLLHKLDCWESILIL